MTIRRLAALVSLAGSVLLCFGVWGLLGGDAALITAGLLLLAAGVSNLS